MFKSVWNYFDPLSMVVIVLTLVLFVIALFVKDSVTNCCRRWSVSGFGEADHDEPQERCLGQTGGRKIGEDPESAPNHKRAERLKHVAHAPIFTAILSSTLRSGMLHFLTCRILRSELHGRES